MQAARDTRADAARAAPASAGAVAAPAAARRGLCMPAPARGVLQCDADPARPGSRSAPDALAVARRGVVGAGGPLPHLEAIQRSFGHHDVRALRTHVGGAVALAAQAIGARAYAVDGVLAFAGPPALGQAAHEAAHAVQQRLGARPPGGIGRVGDALERHADAVAAQVLQGRSAAGLLDATPGAGPVASAGAPAGPALQRQVIDAPVAPGASAAAAAGYDLVLTYPPDQRQVHRALPPAQALAVLRQFAGIVDAHQAGGLEGHRFLARLRGDQPVVAAISSLLGGVGFPPLSQWDGAQALLARARGQITAGAVADAAASLQQAAIATRRCEQAVLAYQQGSITGAERTVLGLEVVQVAAAVTVSVGTGGTAGVLLGAGYAGAQRLAGEAAAVQLGLQSRIDWAGIGFDVVFAALAGRFGGRLASAVAARLGGRLAARVVASLLAARASGILHAVARQVFDAARGETALTLDGLVDRVAAQLTVHALFLDLVATATGMGVARATAPRPAAVTPPSPPPATGGGRPALRLLQGGGGSGRGGGGPAVGRTAPPVPALPPARGVSAGPRIIGSNALDMRSQPALPEPPVPVARPHLVVAQPLPAPQAHAVPVAPPLPLTPVASAAAVVAAVGPASGPPATSSPPVQVVLQLPGEKAAHADLYAALVAARALEHTPALPRHTAQREAWDRALRPGGPMAIYSEIWQALEELDIGEDRRLRPNWTRSADTLATMQVDHRVEWQLLGAANRQWGDTMSNFELLDPAANGLAGSRLQANIQRERQRLAGLLGPQLLTQRIVFTALQVEPPRPAQRWLPEEIQEGAHYHALRRHLRRRGG